MLHRNGQHGRLVAVRVVEDDLAAILDQLFVGNGNGVALDEVPLDDPFDVDAFGLQLLVGSFLAAHEVVGVALAVLIADEDEADLDGLAFFGGIGGASARGILIKGSSYLEMLAKTDRVVFDKTGTLTRGTFAVTAVRPAQPELSGQALLQLAAAAERFSDHPVSQSLRRAAGQLPEALATTDARELAGHGVTAQVGGRAIAAGNAKLMATLGLTAPAVDEIGTVIHVAADGAYLGYIVISDEPKSGAREAIARLRADGVRVVMLTGDRKRTADAVAQELGIAEVHSELLPEDKVTQVERLLGEGAPGKYLAFVGDGINDAPVLARADLGAAMGGIGSDAAIEAADIVLMDDDPRKLSLAMRISRKTMRLVWQNIVFALAVKAVCLVLGALGIANMWVAIFADVGVMVLCVLNAARALDTKRL